MQNGADASPTSAALFERQVKKGLECRARRDYRDALIAFNSACQLRPAAAGARCELAFTYLQTGALDTAFVHYRRASHLDPTNPDALAGLAHVSRLRNQLDAAIDYMRKAAQLNPTRIDIQRDLAQMLREARRPDEAVEILRALLSLEPHDWASNVALGLLARERSDHTSAVTHFRRALGRNPTHLGIHQELALSLHHAGLHADAAARYRVILGHDPADVDAMVGLAAALRAQRDPSAAVACLRKALELRPADLNVRLELAATLRESTRLDQADEAYRAVLQASPDNWSALVGLGLTARLRGDHESATAHFQAAAALHPKHPGIRSELALSLRLCNRLDEAEALYRTMGDADPKAGAPLHGLSLVALERGDFASAISLARSALELAPDSVDSLLLLAAILRDCGRIDEATTLAERSLALAPKRAGPWIERGLLWRIRNDRAAALASFERAANIEPERAWLEVAAEHVALGRPDQARKAYEAILSKTPMHLEAWLGLAGLEMAAARYEKCVEICTRLTAVYPNRVAPYRQKCRALVQLDRAEEALQIATELSTRMPDSLEAVAARLEILRTCGLRAEAESLLSQPRIATTRSFATWLEVILARLAFFDLTGAESALSDPPAVRPYERSRVLYVRGLLADLQWRMDDAAAAFESALAIHADDPGAHHHLARLHFLRGDPERASSHLRSMITLSSSTLSLRGESKNVSQSLIGQLLNELRLDPELQSLIATLQQHPPQSRIEPLLRAIDPEMELTPRAIYLMLALRQSGALETPRPVNDDVSTALIPRKIVQFWDQATPPPEIDRLLRTWPETHPDYEYRRFDSASASAYLAANYPEEVLAAYRNAKHPAQKSDLFRLAHLFREGGFYVDADDRCVGKLALIAAPNAVFIGYQEQYATLGNNFLGAVPGEPVIGRALRLAVEAVSRGDSEAVWLATGPGLLSRAFAQELAAQGASWRDWLRSRRILDRKELNEVSWPHAILRYKETRRGWLRSVFKSRRAATRLPSRC